MNQSKEDLKALSYKDIQNIAKEEDIKANKKKSELIEQILDQKKQGIRKIGTGIPGLDKITHGGIPEKSHILLSGEPGSGKTTMALHFLLEGIRNGENTVFVNLEERQENIIRNASVFGWDLEKYVDENKLNFERASNNKHKKALRVIDNLASRFDAERIVLDSLSVLNDDKSNSKKRGTIKNINQRFSRLEATTMSIADIEGDNISKYGVEHYAADGIIRLYYKRIHESFKRGIAVRKMRGSNHSKKIHPLEINENGMEVYSDQKIFKNF